MSSEDDHSGSASGSGSEDTDGIVDDVGPFKEFEHDIHCTDKLFVLLFILFWIGMFVVGFTAVGVGNTLKLSHGEDMYGNLCGLDNAEQWGDEAYGRTLDATDLPVLVFPNPMRKDISYCAAECPTAFAEDMWQPSIDEALCPYRYANESASGASYVDGFYFFEKELEEMGETVVPLWNMEPSPFAKCYWPYPAQLEQGRCIPDFAAIAEYLQEIETNNGTYNGYNVSINGTNPLQQAADAQDTASDVKDNTAVLISDLMASWLYILICTCAAFVLSLFWLLLINKFAGCMVWTTVILVYMLCIALTALLWSWYDAANQEIVALEELGWGDQVTDGERANVNFLWMCTCVALLFDVLFFFLILFFRKKLNLAINVLKIASEAMTDVWTIIFIPILLFVVFAGLYAYITAIWIYLGSVGTPTHDADGHYKGDKVNQEYRGMQLYHVFGWFWGSSFLLAGGQMSIAGAVGKWYYGKKKLDKKGRVLTKLNGELDWPVWNALKRTFWYHLGSIAFGSFIVAVVKMAQYMLEHVKQQCEKSGNDVAVKILKCLKCCFWCLEKILKFINMNAYVLVINSYGYYSFCGACKEAFYTLVENAGNLVAIQAVSSFLLFLGKFFVVLISTGLCCFLARSDDDITFWIAPCMMVALFSFAVATCFLELYEMCIDTIFLLACYDIRHSGEEKYAGVPWVPEKLRKYMNENSTMNPAHKEKAQMKEAEAAAVKQAANMA